MYLIILMRYAEDQKTGDEKDVLGFRLPMLAHEEPVLISR